MNSNTIDTAAMFKIGYGLYIITTAINGKDNGFVANSVCQLTSDPLTVAVTINKSNYSYDIVKETGRMNVNCLTQSTPFETFQRYGFSSGRDTDKFQGVEEVRTEGGLRILPQHINAYFSLTVEQCVELSTHGLFICSVEEAKVLNDEESVTYAYYHSHIKPRPKNEGGGWVCKICGYVHKGDTLPEDFICPICKHPASDFEPLKEADSPKEEKSGEGYACLLCGWEYDPQKGAPDLGIAPGTPFEDLPEDFTCPVCGVGKENIAPKE